MAPFTRRAVVVSRTKHGFADSTVCKGERVKANEKPQNGIAGLRHWRYDILSGLQVALVSLPLSLGIAIASGAPPVAGLVSAIIAGFVFPFLGGAYVTISGPAAGLAPALLAGMLVLGNGDLAAGYPLVLVAICLAGLLMILLSIFRAGNLVAMFLPVTVVEAMLAAIGIMIIVKQVPALLGDLSPGGKTIPASIAKLPESFQNIEPSIFIIGGLCLFLMFYLNRTRRSALRKIPPPLTVCAVGVALGYVFGLDTTYLIRMPDNVLEGGITLPAFDVVLNRPELWGSVLLIVITLTLIDSVESLATIRAVDKIDPYQRKSQPNVTLRAMGVSNLVSSLFGGLTIIPGGIKSRANIDAGGRTLWANFYNAMFLLIFLFFAKDIISRIPLAAIGAVIVYVGWRLCEPTVFARTFAIGRDQLAVFLITIAAILATDLLIGILIGVAAQVLLLGYLLTPSFRLVMMGRITSAQLLRTLGANLLSLFRSPVIRAKQESEAGRANTQLSLTSLAGFNLFPLDRALAAVPSQSGVTLTLTESGRIIDHTTMEYLHQFEEECVRHGRPFAINGLERFHPFTSHPLSTRIQDMRIVKEREKRSTRAAAMAEFAQRHGFSFAADTAATLNQHDFVYLRRGSDREETNAMTGLYRGCEVKLFDYSHTAAPDYYVEHRHTLIVVHPPAGAGPHLPDLAITPGSYLERYLIAEYGDVELDGFDQAFAENHRVYALDPARAREFLAGGLLQHVLQHPGFYVEIRNNTLLAFRPDNGLEPVSGLSELLSFADWCAARASGDSRKVAN